MKPSLVLVDACLSILVSKLTPREYHKVLQSRSLNNRKQEQRWLEHACQHYAYAFTVKAQPCEYGIASTLRSCLRHSLLSYMCFRGNKVPFNVIRWSAPGILLARPTSIGSDGIHSLLDHILLRIVVQRKAALEN